MLKLRLTCLDAMRRDGRSINARSMRCHAPRISQRLLRAAALLVFLAGAARARLVGPNLGLVARDGLYLSGFFAGGGCRLIRACEGQAGRTTRRTTLLQLFGRLFGNDL